MSIKFSEKAPEKGLQLVAEHLSKSRVPSKKGLFESLSMPKVQVGQAIQLWSIGSEGTSKPIHEALTPGNWQYLLFEDEEVISASYINEQKQHEGVYATSYGALIEGVTEGLRSAEQLLEKQSATFEPRIIVIPAIHFTGLWLHDTNDNWQDDIVLPIPPSGQQLTNYEPISLEEFEKHLNEAMALVREQQEKNPGESGGSGFNAPYGDTIQTKRGIPGILGTHHIASLIQEQKLATTSAVQLSFVMQAQQQTNWCWSAVGTSVGLFYKTGNWTQCDTATGCLPGQNCCVSPGPCNVYGYLNKSLTYTKSYNTSVGGVASTNQIRSQLNAGNPVCTRVAWYGNGAHFMAITGINSSNVLTIQDSIYGTSAIAYNSYPGHYHSGGTWTHTYYCQKN